MRISYIGIQGLPSKGGAERVVEAIVQRLAERHEITVYCSSRYTTPDATIPGVRLIRLTCLPGKYTRMTSLNFLAAWHAVWRGNYDLVHLHNIEACFVLPILRLKYPVISTAHGRITPGNKWNRIAAAVMRLMEVPYGKMSNAMTSVSLPHAQQFRTRFHRLVSYIPNGVNTAIKADVEAARYILAANQLSEKRYILFSTNRIIPLKGAHLLLNSFRRIEANCRLVIVGDLSQSSEYVRHLRMSADDRTVFVPFVHSLTELLGLIKLSRLFVLPSINEGMSMALLEASSIGAPILCSDIPANTSVLPDQALYFHSNDVDDLANKLQWALDHPKEMSELGQRAEAWVKEKYSWDLIAEQYDQLYQQYGDHHEHSLRRS